MLVWLIPCEKADAVTFGDALALYVPPETYPTSPGCAYIGKDRCLFGTGSNGKLSVASSCELLNCPGWEKMLVWFISNKNIDAFCFVASLRLSAYYVI